MGRSIHIFKIALAGVLVFISNYSFADVIWRTTSIGFSQSSIEAQMSSSANSNALFYSSSLQIDVDQNGVTDFSLAYSIQTLTGVPASCIEGVVSSNVKTSILYLSGQLSENLFLSATQGQVCEFYYPGTPTGGGYYGLTSLEKQYYTPYPSTICNFSSSNSTKSRTPISNSFQLFTMDNSYNNGYCIGVKFKRNGNIHTAWMKIVQGVITEIAWEDTPFYPIQIASTASVFSHGILQYVSVSGQAFIDANANCILDVNEKVLANTEVSIKNTTYKAITNIQGYYVFYIPYQNGVSYELDAVVKNTYGMLSATCNTFTLPTITTNGQAIQKNIVITPSSCANIEVKTTTNPLRRCFRSSFTVDYKNTGTVAATGQQIKVIIPTWLRAISSTPAWTSQSNDTLTYNLATVSGLSDGQIRVIDSVVCDEEMIRGMDQCIKAFVEPNQNCVAGNIYTDADVQVSGICNAGVVEVTLKNIGASMAESAEYRVLLNRDLVKSTSYQLATGATLSFDVPTNGKTTRIEVDQIASHPILKYRAFALEGCGDFILDNISKGIIHTQSSVREGNAESTVCSTIQDSFDPNDKNATPGEGLIEPNKELYYTIRFQNTGSASAINIVVDDTLSDNLDIRTLSIVGTSHPSVMSNYIFDANGKKVLKFTFYNINLVKQATSEVLSQGYVTFKISQVEDLAVGEFIKNKAFIYFDYNSAIITNETIHEIGLPINDALLKVTSSLDNQEACAGDNVSLEVTAANEKTYAWYKDDELIENETTATYSVLSLSNANAGVYTCKVIGVMDTISTTSTVALKTPSACEVTSVQNKNQSNFKLYPNPAKSDLHIELAKAGTYSIANVYGLVVLRGELSEGVNTIGEVQNLKQGTYLVSIKVGEDIATERLIIQ